MDPNANLIEQRRLAARLLDGKYTPADARGAALQLAELVEALDRWISNGGFLPDRWQIGQKRGDRP